MIFSRRLADLTSISDFNGYEGRTTANWDSVLRLATLWEFKNIRALAINKVDPLATPLEKLAMARAFDVSTWIRPSLVALCTRSEPLTLAEGRRLSTEDLISITSAREAVRNTQLAPNERDVSSYISEHILCERSTDAVVVSTVPTENVSGSPTSCTQPNLATSTIVKAPDVPPFTPWPSAHQVESLLAAISQSDFKSALDMASHEGAKAFIDALRNFTPVSRDPRMAERLTLAILHQGCRTSSFITIGVALFSELTAHFCTQITDDGTTWKLHPYLKWRSDTSHQFNDAMSLIRSQFRSFDLALRHITVAQPFGDPGWFLDILRAGESLSLTESVYDERYANLRTYFTRLEQAGLAYY